MTKFSIGLVGAGGIGRMHVDAIRNSGFCQLAGIADPTEAGQRYSDSVGAPWFKDHRALLAQTKLDAIIVATPNNTHRRLASTPPRPAFRFLSRNRSQPVDRRSGVTPSLTMMSAAYRADRSRDLLPIHSLDGLG